MQLTYTLNVSYQEDADLGEAEHEWDVNGERKRQDAVGVEYHAWGSMGGLL